MSSPPIGEMIDEALDCQRRGRAAWHRRIDQSHHPPGGDGAGAGIVLTWQDISTRLSDAVPLLARVYPNGPPM
jgi:phosphogluconate dehydratase